MPWQPELDELARASAGARHGRRRTRSSASTMPASSPCASASTVWSIAAASTRSAPSPAGPNTTPRAT